MGNFAQNCDQLCLTKLWLKMFYKTGPPRQFEHFDLWDDSHVGNFIQKFAKL